LCLGWVGGGRGDAEKGATWAITKKLFFDPSKNAVFWQIFKIASERTFQAMNTGLL
jgi:hypothetical protein